MRNPTDDRSTFLCVVCGRVFLAVPLWVGTRPCCPECVQKRLANRAPFGRDPSTGEPVVGGPDE